MSTYEKQRKVRLDHVQVIGLTPAFPDLRSDRYAAEVSGTSRAGAALLPSSAGLAAPSSTLDDSTSDTSDVSVLPRGVDERPLPTGELGSPMLRFCKAYHN